MNMLIGRNWLQMLWNAATETGSGTPTETPETTTPPADEEPPKSEDLLGDDTPKPEDKEGDLIGDDAPKDEDTSKAAGFNTEEVTLENLQESLGEDAELDPEQSTAFLEIVNGAESRADLATKLVAFYEAETAKQAEALNDSFKTTVDGWRNEVKNHPKLGGENLNPALAKVKTAINTYAENPAETLKFMSSTGIGNSIHIIQLVHALAEAVPGEARPAEGAPASSGTKPLEQRMFPNAN